MSYGAICRNSKGKIMKAHGNRRHGVSPLKAKAMAVRLALGSIHGGLSECKEAAEEDNYRRGLPNSMSPSPGQGDCP